MLDDQIPNSERDTAVTPRARDTAVTPRLQHEYSNTVMTTEPRGIAPSVVVALILATIAIAIAIAVLVSERRQDEPSVAVAEPLPTLQPSLLPQASLPAQSPLPSQTTLPPQASIPAQSSLPPQPSLPQSSLPVALPPTPQASKLPSPAASINPAIVVKPSVPNAMVTPEVEVDDDKLQEQVQQRLRATPGLAGAAITVKVSGGQVTLSGEVEEPLLKSLAEQVAKKIKGVTKVINEITVS